MNHYLPTDRRFSVMIASDCSHDNIYAEIYYDDKFVALVSQEKGLDSKVLEFPGPDLVEGQICREVDLKGFLVAVEFAAQMLSGD